MMIYTLLTLLFSVVVVLSESQDVNKCISVQQGHKSILSIGPLESSILLITTDLDLFEQDEDGALTSKHLTLRPSKELHMRWPVLYDKLKGETVDSSAKLISMQSDKLLFVSSNRKSIWLFDSTKNSVVDETVNLDPVPPSYVAWTTSDDDSRLLLFGGDVPGFAACALIFDKSLVEVQRCETRNFCKVDNGEDKISVKMSCNESSSVSWSGSIVNAFIAKNSAYLLTKEFVYVFEQSALISADSVVALSKISLLKFIGCEGANFGEISKGFSTTWLIVIIILIVLLILCMIIMVVLCRSSNHHHHSKPRSSKKPSSGSSSRHHHTKGKGHSKRKSSAGGHSSSALHRHRGHSKASPKADNNKLDQANTTMLKDVGSKNKNKFGPTFASTLRANSSNLKDIPTRWDSKEAKR